MNKTEYDEIINGEDTYKEIADKLKTEKTVLVGWTDELSTHYDFLFSLGAYKEINNYIQGGLRKTDLFVSVMRKGAFGFEINNNIKSPSYIGEKLFWDKKADETTEKVADLINGIIKYLIDNNLFIC